MPAHWVVSAVMPRLGAAVADLAILTVLIVLVQLLLLLGGAIVGRLGGHDPYADGVSADIGVLTFAVALLYVGLTEGRRGPHNGQTFGKQLADIRTVTARGGLPVGRLRTWLRAPVRAAFTPLTLPIVVGVEWVATAVGGGAPPAEPILRALLAAIFLVTALSALLSTSRRAWHDRLFGTAVVHDAIVDEHGPHAAQQRVVPLPVRGIARSPQTILLVSGWFGLSILHHLS